MIIDRIDRFDLYRSLSPLLPVALQWLHAEPERADGRYEIDGDRLFAMVQGYATEPAAAKKWEAHRAYVDLQVVTAGVEMIGYAPVETLTIAESYDAEKDVAFYDAPADGGATLVHVPAGMAMLLLPGDAHQPGVQAGRPGAVRKVVFKLAAEAFRS